MKKLNKEIFIERSNIKHNFKYTYEQLIYVHIRMKVKINCPIEGHGIFEQDPANHLNGSGCPKCAIIDVHLKQKMSDDEFKIKSKEMYGDKYDYSLLNYIDYKTKVKLICKEHNKEFEQTPNSHFKIHKNCGCSRRIVNIKEKVVDNDKTTEYILRFKKIHGDKYDYSKFNFISTKEKITIICPVHNEFEQLIGNHLKGGGCIKCSLLAVSLKNRGTKEWFEIEANKVHGNYTYELVDYKNNKTKVKINCPIEGHGIFEQQPSNHLNGQGCPKCGGSYIYNTEEMVERFKKVHGDLYNYSLVDHKNSNTPVKIICSVESHGIFEQYVHNHLKGAGCTKCAGFNKTTELYIQEANKTHGDVYDYSKLVYTMAKDKVEIICKKHGSFFQQAGQHLNGAGCPKCKLKTSFPEQAIFYYLNKLDLEVINQYKMGSNKYEVDIYIPELQFGIEYDGAYFHKNKEKKDTEKIKIFKKEGIEVIRIRESGLLSIDNCHNILIDQRTGNKEIERVIIEIIDYINDKYNKNYTISIDLDKDKNEILYATRNTKVENSLLHTHPKIAKQWHPTKNGDLKPEFFTYGVRNIVWWQCEKGHEWERSISSSFKSKGCPICDGNSRSNTNEFKEKANMKHGVGKFDYSQVDYIDIKTKVIITCENGHTFKQGPNEHLQGYGCKKCGDLNVKLKLSFNKEEFKKRANAKHGVGKFDYSQVIYVNSKTKVSIICQNGHTFLQMPSCHLVGQGCPYCYKIVQKNRYLK